MLFFKFKVVSWLFSQYKVLIKGFWVMSKVFRWLSKHTKWVRFGHELTSRLTKLLQQEYSVSNKKSLKSIVTRIQNDVKNGNSFYYFKVKDYPNIFVGSSQISYQLPMTMVGDSIKISFDIDLEEVIDVSSFENINLKASMKSK